ncbi:MAG TPA: hypothetical protein VHK04_04275 [Castellaniella sp.]|jgi:hypothetical protein|nr:hypothetical protein [Castellaniella sp.]
MTDLNQHKTYGSWVAIDIAKDFNVVMVETACGNVRRFRMANSSQDHERLVATIVTNGFANRPGLHRESL